MSVGVARADSDLPTSQGSGNANHCSCDPGGQSHHCWGCCCFPCSPWDWPDQPTLVVSMILWGKGPFLVVHAQQSVTGVAGSISRSPTQRLHEHGTVSASHAALMKLCLGDPMARGLRLYCCPRVLPIAWHGPLQSPVGGLFRDHCAAPSPWCRPGGMQSWRKDARW